MLVSHHKLIEGVLDQDLGDRVQQMLQQIDLACLNATGYGVQSIDRWIPSPAHLQLANAAAALLVSAFVQYRCESRTAYAEPTNMQ